MGSVVFKQDSLSKINIRYQKMGSVVLKQDSLSKINIRNVIIQNLSALKEKQVSA